MKERCIMIFPEFENIKIIDDIRSKYDPLAEKVRPHITLAFPFTSDIEADELMLHLSKVLCDEESFEIELQGILPVKTVDNYLFLMIKEGADSIVRIHEKIYSGIMEKFYPIWLKRGLYHPHMTVGRINNEEAFNLASEEVTKINDLFCSKIQKVSVEIIDEDENSIIEMEIPLLL